MGPGEARRDPTTAAYLGHRLRGSVLSRGDIPRNRLGGRDRSCLSPGNFSGQTAHAPSRPRRHGPVGRDRTAGHDRLRVERSFRALMVARRPALAEGGIAAKGHHGRRHPFGRRRITGRHAAVRIQDAGADPARLRPRGSCRPQRGRADCRRGSFERSSRPVRAARPEPTRPAVSPNRPPIGVRWASTTRAINRREGTARYVRLSPRRQGWQARGPCPRQPPVEGGRPIELPHSLAFDLLLAACQNAVD